MDENVLNTRVDVLDHGRVELIDHMGSDHSVVQAARVSYANEEAIWDENNDTRLLRYLYRNGHTTPFEMVELKFLVQIPLFLTAQWQRHRTWSYNQVSARYTALDMGYYVPDTENIGGKQTTNKQGSDPDALNPGTQVVAQEILKEAQARSFENYHHLRRIGVADETARIVLPVGTYTRFYAKVDMHNLMHFLKLRVHAHAQYEIQQYARAILTLIEPLYPNIIRIFKEEEGLEYVS